MKSKIFPSWIFFNWIFLCVAVFGAFAAPRPVVAADNAVIFMYHRFGERAFPSTNIRISQFRSHLEELKNGPYEVLPIPVIIEKLRKGEELPEYAVGISIDDAYLSVYEEAWPILRRYKFPFTVFVATDAVDRNASRYMNWDQIRELARNGVTIGSQTAGHLRMVRSSKARNRGDIERANRRFEKELGITPALFAYPYGEYSTEVRDLISDMGFEAAFGQHSGAISSGSDFYELSRFAMNEEYGNLDRFKLAAKSLALPTKDVTPSNPLVTKDDDNPPAIGFTLTRSIGTLRDMACFASGKGKADISVLADTRVEVRVDGPFNTGRARINCTKPAGDGRWYWFGRQLIVR